MIGVLIGFVNDVGRLCYESVGLVVLQNTTFLALILIALYALRNAPARIRHTVALVGLVKLVTPPFVPFREAAVTAYIQLPTLPSVNVAPGTDVSGAVSSPDGVVSLTLAGVLFGIWCAVGAGVFARTIVNTVRLRMALRDAASADDADARDGFRRTGIRVRVTRHVPVPMTVGLFPRTIFVPPQWTTWSSAGRRAVLRHELAHIRRRDGLVRLLETVVRALYWFHPLVSMLCRRLDTYREQACDDAAATPDPAGRVAYSRLLVDIAEHLVQPTAVRGSASALLRRRHELIGRVRYLTQEGSIMKWNPTRTMVLAIGLAAAITSLSWYHSTAIAPVPATTQDVVDVSLTGGDHVVVDGKRTAFEKLGEYLKAEITNEDAVVRIKCDDEVTMSTLFQTHAVLRAAGLLKVKYIGFRGDAMPLMLPSEKLIKKTQQISTEYITHLAVASGGTCTLDGVELDPSMIREAVAKRLAANDKLIVSLDMAENATYGQYVRTLGALKAANANRIFINEPRQPQSP